LVDLWISRSIELAHAMYLFWSLGVEKSGPHFQEDKSGLSISSLFQKKDLNSWQEKTWKNWMLPTRLVGY
jgi:hypothetical protein